MANDEAWQAGMDIASKRKNKKNGKGNLLVQASADKMASPKSFKKGGKVKKSGYARVHKDEVVLTAGQAKGRRKSGKKKAARKRVARKA